jgi:hypothetical protein
MSDEQPTKRTVTAESVFCTHPAIAVVTGPTIPRVYGTGRTECCIRCGAWRPTWLPEATWRSRDTLAEAMKEDETDSQTTLRPRSVITQEIWDAWQKLDAAIVNLMIGQIHQLGERSDEVLAQRKTMQALLQAHFVQEKTP